MLLAELVATSERVARASARNEKIAELARALARLAPDEIATGVAYLSGDPGLRRTGIGPSAVQRVQEIPPAAEPSLTLGQTSRALAEIAPLAGPGSTSRRSELLGELFAKATGAEQHFLSRLLFGELRQGAQEGLMLEAVARATGIPAADVRRACMLSGDAAAVARAALGGGREALGGFALELMRPIQPMLAGTAEELGEDLARLGSAAAEYKLDGARVQVHRVGREVRVFSRQLNDVTAAVPELVEAALALPVERIVLDGEAIAFRPGGTPQPFQVTMRRFGRRLDVEALRHELPLASQYFDVLHVDGQDLLDLPAAERVAALEAHVPEPLRVPRAVVSSREEIEAFLERSLNAGHEGLMLKSLAAPYEAGRRGASWLKLKPSHTFDLVVLAVEWGSGRRKGWLSNLHLGARDPKTGGFVMLGKTFKGLTDVMLRWQTEKLLSLELGREGHVVHVRPELVVEIAFDGVQQSPHYPAGLALRFARVKRYREDKSAAEADTIDAIRAIYERQMHGP